MWRALSLYLARSFSHTHTETDRLCVKQIWHHDTKSHWFYVMRKSQLTTQLVGCRRYICKHFITYLAKLSRVVQCNICTYSNSSGIIPTPTPRPPVSTLRQWVEWKNCNFDTLLRALFIDNKHCASTDKRQLCIPFSSPCFTAGCCYFTAKH